MSFKNICTYCLVLLTLSSCQSFDSEKYGFNGFYVRPNASGIDNYNYYYIEANEDTEGVTFILKESKSNNLPVDVLLAVGMFSLGEWFDLDFVELILEDGQKFQLKGPIERSGSPISRREWTDTLSEIELKSKHRPQFLDEKPTYDGQIYKWMTQTGWDEKREKGIYTIYTGIYHMKVEESYTREMLLATLPDNDLKSVSKSKTVTLKFYSRNPLLFEKKVIENQGKFNNPQIKKRILDYYFNHKDMSN